MATSCACTSSTERGAATERASWETILAYADDQLGEAAAGRGPKRHALITERYRRYTAWCASRGHTGVDLVLAISVWRERPSARRGLSNICRVALEPNIVPYHLVDGIEHWVLWFDPVAHEVGWPVVRTDGVPGEHRRPPSTSSAVG